MALTVDQVKTLIIIERTAASISATSTLILLATFCSVKAFRTLSNTLIFYASFANLFANMAALIGGEALNNPDGALCQFQAFLLEMFMQSDPFWACAMAVNVYLVFFMRYDPVSLKGLHWVYFLLCYGLPLIPALFCLFYRERGRGRMYGNATLWCWIDADWKWVRIYSYYLPIWIAIAISLTIYFRVGFELYRVRAQIRALENSSENTSNNYNSAAFTSMTATSRTVTSGTLTNNQDSSLTPGLTDGPITPQEDIQEDYLWRLDSVENGGMNYYPRANRFGSQSKTTDDGSSNAILSRGPISHPSYFSIQQPPTVSPLDPVFTPPNAIHNSPTQSPQRTTMDKVKWAYTKCALLFGVSILITWVPASINRVHGLAHEAHPSFALNVMSAMVLPLQGFWNTVIFFTTSWSITRRTFRRWRRKQREKRGIKEPASMGERQGRSEKQSDQQVPQQAGEEIFVANDSGVGTTAIGGDAKEEPGTNGSAQRANGRASDRTLTG